MLSRGFSFVEFQGDVTYSFGATKSRVANRLSGPETAPCTRANPLLQFWIPVVSLEGVWMAGCKRMDSRGSSQAQESSERAERPHGGILAARRDSIDSRRLGWLAEEMAESL
jgi:hypothetical protein